MNLNKYNINEYKEKEYNQKYDYYDNYISSENEKEADILSNYHQYTHEYLNDNNTKKHNINNTNKYSNNNENLIENYYHQQYHKKQKSTHENYLSNKHNNESYIHNEKQSINSQEKFKPTKKICPLFRKIKILDHNSESKSYKEGKYQFLHQKLYMDDLPNENKQSKHKQNEIDSMFDNLINTNDIAYHLTLYNIQKYR